VRKNSVHSQKGAILPLIILGVLVVGILVGTKLVSVPQLFKSQAASSEVKFVGANVKLEGDKYVTTTSSGVEVELTSPFGLQSSGNPIPKAGPILEQNFDDKYKAPVFRSEKRTGRPVSDPSKFVYKETGYIDGVYRLTQRTQVQVVEDGGYDKVAKEFSAVFDAKLQGDRSLGVHDVGVMFGGNSNECVYTSSVGCFDLMIHSSGRISLGTVKTYGEGTVYDYSENSKIVIPNDQWFKMRVDKGENKIKGWISVDNGVSWQEFINYSASISTPGTNFGFEIRTEPKDNNREITTTGYFDNLKIYRLGDLAEPSSGFYRYAADPDSINNDPDGNNVKWQAYSAHPYRFTLPYSLRLGTNILYVQFKSSSGEKSRIYQSLIELRDTGVTPTVMPTGVVGGPPSFSTSTVCANADNEIEIRGSNFGNAGTIYYSRGGSHEVVAAQIKGWDNSLIKLGRGVDDPASPVVNTVAGGQYLKICRGNPYGCSTYTILPELKAGSCNP